MTTSETPMDPEDDESTYLRRVATTDGCFVWVWLPGHVAPVVAVAFVWRIMLNPQYGIVNVWGQDLLGWDRPIDFLGQAPYALLTVIAFEIWRYFPFAFLFISARLVAAPKEIEEAAAVDGATTMQTFRHVLLPQLLPVVALLAVLRVIMTFNKFDDVYLLTGGGPADLTHVLATIGIRYLRLDQVDLAMASIVVALPLVLPLVYFMMKRLSK